MLVGVCCIVALGVSATTLESSLSTSPDDVIDLDYDELPIGQESLADAKKQAIQKGKPDTRGDPSDVQSQSDNPQTSDQSQSQGRGQGTGLGYGVPSLLDRLLGLLYSLLAYAAVTLAIGLAAAAGYRYRDRIRDHLAGLWPESDRAGESLWVRDEDQGYALEATNPVHEAWLELLDRAGIDDPHARSPRESARRAVENGLPREPVERVTREFEAVRYGPAEPTQDRVDRVESELARISRRGLDGRQGPDGRKGSGDHTGTGGRTLGADDGGSA